MAFPGSGNLRSLSQMWGRCQSGWKSERDRGTERAIIFGEERFAEIFNRSDGAGLKCGFLERFSTHNSSRSGSSKSTVGLHPIAQDRPIT